MQHYYSLCLLLLLTGGVLFTSAATTTVKLDADSLSLWPQPQIISNTQDGKSSLNFTRICLDKAVFVESDWNKLAECEKNFIVSAFSRLSTRYQFSQNNYSSSCVKISLKKPVSSTCKISLLSSSEKYQIWLNGNYTTIQTDTIYGALRAIQTLAQIMDQANSIVKYANSQVVISPIYIQDYPYYSYRGIMLDTARHFIAVDSLKRHIDSMEVVKLNAFHLHITDDESFPINMTKYSSAYKFNGGPLTFEILRDLNEYCAERGIQFVPEIDSPSHSKSWSTYYPSIMYSGCNNHLDMGNQDTYQVVSSVYQFLFKMLGSSTSSTRIRFNNQLIHTGFDEIDGNCYADDATLQKYQKFVLNNVLQNGSTIAGDDSTNKMLPIVWGDDLITDMNYGNTSALPRDTILQIWRSETTLTAALKYSYKTIVSIDDPWYINSPCSSRTFEKVYQYKPPVHPSIIGGATCMWTSSGDTDNDLEEYVWPRAAAVAERLWTNPCNPIPFWNSTFSYRNQKLSRKNIVIQRIVKTGLNAQTYDCSSIVNPTFSSNCTSTQVVIPSQPVMNDVVASSSVKRDGSSIPASLSKVGQSVRVNQGMGNVMSNCYMLLLLLGLFGSLIVVQ